MKPSWNDAGRWRDLVAGRNCPLCDRGAQPGVAAELSVSWATVSEDVGVRGYCCLVLKRHCVELHELSPTEGAAFMDDIRRVADAVQRLTGCIKLNYEIYGNVVPHVHVHIVPRHPGDEIEKSGRAFNQLAAGAWAPGELAGYAAELRAALGEA